VIHAALGKATGAENRGKPIRCQIRYSECEDDVLYAGRPVGWDVCGYVRDWGGLVRNPVVSRRCADVTERAGSAHVEAVGALGYAGYVNRVDNLLRKRIHGGCPNESARLEGGRVEGAVEEATSAALTGCFHRIKRDLSR
jgi:hypothetical protein